MLGIVLINYKNSNEVISYIKNEVEKISTTNKIIIVDNSCDENELNYLYSELNASLVCKQHTDLSSQIFIYKAEKNLGFAKANNLGAYFLIKNFANIQYLLFSNSDIKFVDDNIVEKLVFKFNELPQSIAALNPRIIGSDGNDQTPYRKSSFFLTMIIYYLFFPLVYFFYRNYLIKNAKEGTYYHLLGCFLMVRKKSFIEISGFDENTFLYVEEEILAERMLQKDLRSYYYPTCSIIHETGGTTKLHLKNGFARKLFYKNYIYYFHKYRHIPLWLIYIGKVSGTFFFMFYNPLLIFFQKTYANRNK